MHCSEHILLSCRCVVTMRRNVVCFSLYEQICLNTR